MAGVESLSCMIERQLIAELVQQVARSPSDEARQRSVSALVDLVRHCDSSLDATLLEPWTRAYLRSLGLTFTREH